MIYLSISAVLTLYILFYVCCIDFLNIVEFLTASRDVSAYLKHKVIQIKNEIICSFIFYISFFLDSIVVHIYLSFFLLILISHMSIYLSIYTCSSYYLLRNPTIYLSIYPLICYISNIYLSIPAVCPCTAVAPIIPLPRPAPETKT